MGKGTLFSSHKVAKFVVLQKLYWEEGEKNLDESCTYPTIKRQI